MKFRCINNDEMDGILTKGREYAGEMANHRDWIKIFRCDDKHCGYFEPGRFEEVSEALVHGDIVKINHYFIETLTSA